MPRETRLDEQGDRLIYDAMYRVYTLTMADGTVRVLGPPEQAAQILRTEFKMQPTEAMEAINEAFGDNGFPIVLHKVRFVEDPLADYPQDGSGGILWPPPER